MSCALTQNYYLDCRDSLGGIKKVWLGSYNDISSWTGSNGTYTAVSMSGYFWSYELIKESSNFSEAITTNVQNGTTFYAQTLEIILNKLQVSTRNEILLLAKNTLVAIVEDNNGVKWILGKDAGLDITAGTIGSGTAFGDRNGYTITLTGNQKELASMFTGTIPMD